MPPRPKQPSDTFTSLRIIGKKAQEFLAKARSTSKSIKGAAIASTPSPAPLPEITIHLSLKSVLQATLAIVITTIAIGLLFYLRDTVVLLMLGIFLAIVIDPAVIFLEKLRLPRALAVLTVYAIALFLIVSLLISLIPILAEQFQQIADFLNVHVNAFLASPSVSIPLLPPELNARLTDLLTATLQNLSIERFTDALSQLGRSLAVPAEGSLVLAAQIAGSVLNFFVSFILVLVLAFFVQVEKEGIVAWLRSFLPPRIRGYVDDKTEAIHWKLGQWARGQFTLCLSVSVLVLLALVVMRMPYALTLAILAFFLELIPVFGIFFAAIPAILIAFTQQGFLWGVMLGLIYYLVQWCESNLLAPLVMRRTVDLAPLAVVSAMLIGSSFPAVIHPLLGMILAIPVMTIVAIFLEDWQKKHAN